jgi:hypothetical protein
MFKKPAVRRAALGALVLVGAALVPGAAFASHPEVSLLGSNFEIDTDANLKVDDPAPSIDWANVAETRKADKPTGATDDSFGQGTKEDTAVPTVVSGSIPPNKSDLKNFGVYLEQTATTKFIHLFWHRVQEPVGTTNMDFEFNQSTTLSGNGVTPVRTAGDLLIQYDLTQGGTHPELFLSRWVTTGAPSQCEASNTVPCWGTRVNLSIAGIATGSINSSPIPAADSDGLQATTISARTFGEASVNFSALTDPTKCVSFGSAYLKSRSSDAFTSALKDFIAPTPTNINNCATVIIRKQTDPDENPNTTLFGFSKSFNTDPVSANTFSLTDDGVKTYDKTVLFGNNLTVTEDLANLPVGWDFVNVDCSASSGVTPTISGALVTFDLNAETDVLDCTYTNRARGTIIIKKITSDGQGPFDFTSNTLTPASWTLTTTGPGAAGADSRTFGDLAAGTYDAAETVPANWNLTSATCDDGSGVSAIGLSAGETVTCTFVNERERGAIKIIKLRKHAADGPGDHPQPGVTFTINGGELPAAGVTVTTDANGEACLGNLVVSGLVGNYSVTETVPAGYHVDGSATQGGIAVSESTCGSGAAGVTFHNIPLTNLTVSVDSQVNGGTASTIDCGAGVVSTDPNGDGSTSLNDLEPGTYVCTVVIDP